MDRATPSRLIANRAVCKMTRSMINKWRSSSTVDNTWLYCVHLRRRWLSTQTDDGCLSISTRWVYHRWYSTVACAINNARPYVNELCWLHFRTSASSVAKFFLSLQLLLAGKWVTLLPSPFSGGMIYYPYARVRYDQPQVWSSCRLIFFMTEKFWWLPRDALLSAVYAVVVCLSVCLSVCVCVCHTPVLYQNG